MCVVSCTSEQVYGCVAHCQGDRFGAGDPCAPAGHVLSGHTEQTARLLCQHILTVTQKREVPPVKSDVMRVTCGHAGTCAQELTAVPTLTPTDAERVKK